MLQWLSTTAAGISQVIPWASRSETESAVHPSPTTPWEVLDSVSVSDVQEIQNIARCPVHLRGRFRQAAGKVQVHQNHFHQKKIFIKIHFHQKPLSSKTTFIKNQFHQNATFIKMPLSSKSTFIKNHFHQKPFSSKTNFIKNQFHQRPISSKTIFIKNQFHQKPISSEHFLSEGPTTRAKTT